MDTSMNSQSTINSNEDLAKSLKSSLEIKDHKWRTKTYKQCFLHTAAVAHVMSHSNVDEESAVATLNELRAANYIQHVVDPDKTFKSGQTKNLYFCFLDDTGAQQKQKSATLKYLKQAKLSKPMLQDILIDSDDFKALQIKMNRIESAVNQMNESDVSTRTKLEIVHQATISLIQAMVATALLLMVVMVYTIYIIVPSLHQTQTIMLTTSLLGTLFIGAFVLQGMNLFSVWLQFDTCVVQAAEGGDAVEDYEMDQLSVSTSTIGSTSATGSVAIIPSAPPPLNRGTSQMLSNTMTVQQRQPNDLPHPSQWPHRPVLVCANTPTDSSLTVPNYGDGPCPIGKPFHFSSDLFEGQCLVRLRNMDNSDAPLADEAYFAGRKRLFQTIVQGRFKQPLPVSDVLTGHEFVKPLQSLPHPWILKAATNLIGKLAPGAQIRVLGNQPTMLASLAATSQTVRGDEPGNEPDLAATTEDLQEDCSLLGGKFSSGKVSATGRKLHLASPNRASKYTFDTETVYTFDFYQSLLNVKTYSLELGVANIGMAPVLNGQPIQSLCKTTDGRYLWSFQIWHESLLPPSPIYNDDSEHKLKSN